MEPPKEETISVVVRVRPLLFSELEISDSSTWEIPGPSSIRYLNSEKLFLFDRVFDSQSTTQEIFNELIEKPVWDSMEGYNSSIFCYGQTGSGKTFTMHGFRKQQIGIIQMAIDTMFAYIEEYSDSLFLIRCSYLEIYNECVNDLLNPGNVNLQIQEDKRIGLKVVNLTENVCNSIKQVTALLLLGENSKQIASTSFNSRSSRSHCIFRIIVERKCSKSGDMSVATLNLIDLAGSESAAAHTNSVSANRRQEMKYINRVTVT